jgi:hypothetical protein
VGLPPLDGVAVTGPDLFAGALIGFPTQIRCPDVPFGHDWVVTVRDGHRGFAVRLLDVQPP